MGRPVGEEEGERIVRRSTPLQVVDGKVGLRMRLVAGDINPVEGVLIVEAVVVLVVEVVGLPFLVEPEPIRTRRHELLPFTVDAD